MPQKSVDIDPAQTLESTVAALQLPAKPVIILLGDFDSALNDQIYSICSRVIAPVALDPGSLIIDDGGSTGVSALMSRAAQDQDLIASLVGVISNDRAAGDIDPNHDLVLRLPAVWSDWPKWTFQIAGQLLKDGASVKPILAVLLGGKDAEKRAVVRCVRNEWPVLVIDKTGGLADQIMNATTRLADGALPPKPADPELREIIETAILYTSSIDASVDELTQILRGRIDAHPESLTATLQDAWQRFEELDSAAISMQYRFRWVELNLIVLAVMAALFAILSQPKVIPQPINVWTYSWYLPFKTLHFLVILTPIAISLLAAYNSHFREGTKWILLRGAAEALKREIFRFRAKAGAYSDEQCLQSSRQSKLAAKIKDISSALEQSEVNKASLGRASKGTPQGMSFLKPNEYVETRIQNQVEYFAKKIRELARRLRWLQSLIYAAGATATLLAAYTLDIWVALATAVVTALTTKLQADQVETSLVQYNQALASLRNIEAWWTALSVWEKGRRNNIDLLVDQTEKTLESETAGWIQQMQSALDKLTEKERPASSAR